jgi:hypothetical protein
MSEICVIFRTLLSEACSILRTRFNLKEDPIRHGGPESLAQASLGQRSVRQAHADEVYLSRHSAGNSDRLARTSSSDRFATKSGRRNPLEQLIVAAWAQSYGISNGLAV